MIFATYLVVYGMKCLKDDVAIYVIYNKMGGDNGDQITICGII